MNENTTELTVTIFFLAICFGMLFFATHGIDFGNSEKTADTNTIQNIKTWIIDNKWIVSSLILFISVILVSKWVNVQTGIFTSILLAIVFVLVEWLPVWVPVILGVLAAGILVWVLSK
jgi:hypothetical protein